MFCSGPKDQANIRDILGFGTRRLEPDAYTIPYHYILYTIRYHTIFWQDPCVDAVFGLSLMEGPFFGVYNLLVQAIST